MTTCSRRPESPRIVHLLPGRLRAHLPSWAGQAPEALERLIREVEGVQQVRATGATRNVLVRFDPGATEPGAVLQALAAAVGVEPGPPPAVRPPERRAAAPAAPGRARLAVRGLERDPSFAERVVRRLGAVPGVRSTSASTLTGRVLVEFDSLTVSVAELVSVVAPLEGEIAGADEPPPADPVDAAATTHSATRIGGASLALAILVVRRFLGRPGPPVDSEGPFVAAALLSVAEGVPPLRGAMRGVIGDRSATFLLANSATGMQLLVGKTAALGVSAAAALRALTALRARERAWRDYEQRTADAPDTVRGTRVRLHAGERAPTSCVVIDGAATAIGPDALPVPISHGDRVPAGASIHAGPILVELDGLPQFAHPGDRAPASSTLNDRYTGVAGVAAIAAAGLVGVLARSPTAALITLQLLSSRPAAHARQAADHGAESRAIRAGATVVGTRPERRVRRPDVLLVTAARVLADGFETFRTIPLASDRSASDVLRLTGEVATVAGSPWGRALPSARADAVEAVAFDGRVAEATLHGVRYRVTLADDEHARVVEAGTLPPGCALLVLSAEPSGEPLGAIVLRPRPAAGLRELTDVCRRRGISLAMLPGPDTLAAGAFAEAVNGGLFDAPDALSAVRELQRRGAVVAVLSDSVEHGAAFAACDLAVALSSGRSSRFAARADVLVPDLTAAAATLDAGARAAAAERDGTLAAALSTIGSAAWGLCGRPTVRNASRYVTYAAGAALAISYLRLAGGSLARSAVSRLTDPRPERWGALAVDDVLEMTSSSLDGLTSEAARARYRAPRSAARRSAFADALADQLRSPANAVLGAGAALSLATGAIADVVMIAGIVAANTLIEAWQQGRTAQAAEALERLTAAQARVFREGAVETMAAEQVVVGDVLLLASGDHVPADARVISAHNLQVDEASLTGESMPVAKSAENGDEHSRVVLHGSDVTVGTGRAVVVAVGHGTRLGSIAAALEVDDGAPSPLAVRLERMARQGLPVVGGAGALVAAAGVLRGRSAASQIPIAASIAIAAVPEGLQLLASLASAGVAQRLTRQQALVRTLPAVDALGRVDVACADKTGTLTHGRLDVQLVADLDAEAAPGHELPPDLRAVLWAAAVASPHPEASDAGAHPTDVAVSTAAEEAGLGQALTAPRQQESRFDPARGFHSAVAENRLCVKGAVETLAPRCVAVRRGGRDRKLGADSAEEILERGVELSSRGLRVLLVAEGGATASVDDPQGLVALGFVGIGDPLRPGVPDAVRRCHEAGVRVIMLTGDHPETARAIARDAGLYDGGDGLLTGPEVAELTPGELDRRLEQASVIARITPIDKLRIVESLQRRGHVVAMTGDGVNDAPALRLADVGVAMGRQGTQVARQAADVILTEDDFGVLTEALVEGRGFWRNMRRALALLLGGNLGEVGLFLGAAVLGLPAPMTARQILAINLVTDVLPAIAVAIQPPEHRNLRQLAREGAEALDAPLRRDIAKHGVATALPSLAAYAAAVRSLGAQRAGGVAFGAICATQLVLTIADGRSGTGVSRIVGTAVAATGGIVIGTLSLRPARSFLGFAPIPPLGWLLILGAVAGTAGLGTTLERLAPALGPAIEAPRASSAANDAER